MRWSKSGSCPAICSPLIIRKALEKQSSSDALVRHAEDNEVTEVVETVHGMKCVVEGPLYCPSRNDASIRSIWIIDKGSERPRLVSAYPL